MRDTSEQHRPVSGQKDTKRWCKGVEGREHKWKWENYTAFRHPVLADKPYPIWLRKYCSVCTKWGVSAYGRGTKKWDDAYAAWRAGK